MTTILRFMLRDGALLSSSIADDTGIPLDLTAANLPKALKDLNVAAVAAAASADKSVQEATQAAKDDADAKIKEAAEKSAEVLTKATEDANAAKAKAEDLKKQLEEGKAILAEHQKISDDLATRAEKAMAAGDLAALPEIIADAKTFGNAREKKKIIEEADALEKQADALEDKALELREKANKL